MPRVTDQSYLKSEQYKTPANLMARADLHRRFGTNPYPWLRWVFDQLALEAGERVVEAGCGPGWLWSENADRLPAGLRVTLGDFSLGMAREAKRRVSEPATHEAQAARETVQRDGATPLKPGHSLAYNGDVQALPFAAGAFDVAVANHMLYHVPDLDRAAAELARVLAPGGRLCAATNGPAHLQELYALAADYAPWRGESESLFSFRLDNAAAVLGQAFERVEVRRYADALWVTEAQPVVDYLTSMSSFPDLARRVAPDDLRRTVQARIDADGGLHITKEVGVALAWKD